MKEDATSKIIKDEIPEGAVFVVEMDEEYRTLTVYSVLKNDWAWVILDNSITDNPPKFLGRFLDGDRVVFPQNRVAYLLDKIYDGS